MIEGRLRTVASVALVATALAGCVASTSTDRPGLPMDTPETYTAVDVSSSPTGAVQGVSGSGAQIDDVESLPSLDSWWTAFGSDELDRLVSEALDHNHDLGAAVARVDAAAAQARIAGADRFPSVGLSYSGNRAKRNFIGLPIPGAGGVLTTHSTTQGLSLEVSWEADLWGRLKARQRAAVAEFVATDSERHGVELVVVGSTVRSWLALIEARQQVELAERTLESRLRAERRVQTRYLRGVTGSLEYRLARSERALAESSLDARRRALDASQRALEILLGRYPAAQVDVPDVFPPWKGGVPVSVPSELVVRRPDLQAAEFRLQAAGARLDSARRALYPRLTLSASGGTAAAVVGDLLDGGFSVWSLAAGIFQPLFQGGRLRAGVDAAEAEREQMLRLYLQEVLQSFSEVETALAAEEYLQEQEEALAEASVEAAEAEALALRRYTDGLESYLSVLESQRQSFFAESRYLALRRDRLLARVDLILALGGGFDETDLDRTPAKEEGTT